MQKVKDFLTTTDVENMSLQDILLQLELSQQTYNVFLNACNQDILYLWGGNIDLQLVINENATVMYVCNYMTKGEKAMGETLK